MVGPRTARRWMAALAVAALLALGTFGFHHLYADALGGDHASHNCFTCRIVSSTIAIVAIAVATTNILHCTAAPRGLLVGLEHAGFANLLRSRAPPAAT